MAEVGGGEGSGMNIKAIETVYKGYRFRSRLEARWAVFFDALGVEWEYEKQGFDLGAGRYYLPDFWLPKLGAWAEVKPKHLYASSWQVYSPDDSRVVELCEALAEQSQSAVLLLTGELARPPWGGDAESGMMLPYLVSLPTGGHGGYTDDSQEWAICPGCEEPGFAFCGDTARLQCGCGATGYERGERLGGARRLRARERIDEAYRMAKQARFEHGEMPWPRIAFPGKK